MEHIERTPPHNLEAEQAVLGALLLAPDSFSVVSEILWPESFYGEGHRQIYSTLKEMAESGRPIDLLTVTEELQHRELLDKVGGAAYLAELAGAVPSAVNAGYYASIVADKGLLRALINTCAQLATRGYDDGADSEYLLDDAERMIMDLSQKRVSKSYRSIRELLVEVLEKIEQLCQKKGGVTGIPTGFTELDKYTSGLQPSDLILLAARPSMGKTALGLNIAQNMAVKHGIPVGIFSLEMSGDQVAQRLLSAESLVDQQRLRTGFLGEEDWPRLLKAATKLSEAPIYIDDTPAISLLELRSKARRLKLEYGVGMLMIDYLQLMQAGKRTENRVQEISEISRFLKALARELDVPVLALSQLSRAVEQRGGDRKPILSDLRESGSLEQDSDVVMFIYRDEYYNDDSEDKGIADIIISKQRNGPTGTIQLAFLKEFTKFVNLEKRDAPLPQGEDSE
ncbi:MAG: replicative DNA helicase [Syntrophaceticus sp.]|nr:replicative DNA helicase [Syntrophaceticus sp.]MDD4783076.1 replicative DNA helicase [Syntrophaceticus sp.]